MSLERPLFTRTNLNLADPRLGANVYFATDDFFADKGRMIAPTDPVFIADKYDENGKWMDGWESRRKRVPGHDYALINLGHHCHIKGFEFDTRHFSGNHAPAASVQACLSNEEQPDGDKNWVEILPQTALNGDSIKFVEVNIDQAYSHLRLNIYPDGGLSRLRVYGHIVFDEASSNTERLDVAAALNGGRPIACSDEHFGKLSNLIAPGDGLNMGDGWETARRRHGGHDWAILALCAPSTIDNIIIDTAFFKGNYPASCSIQGLNLSEAENELDLENHTNWVEILSTTPLNADMKHELKSELPDDVLTHIKLNIYPDGGISRLRLIGRIS